MEDVIVGIVGRGHVVVDLDRGDVALLHHQSELDEGRDLILRDRGGDVPRRGVRELRIGRGDLLWVDLFESGLEHPLLAAHAVVVVAAFAGADVPQRVLALERLRAGIDPTVDFVLHTRQRLSAAHRDRAFDVDLDSADGVDDVFESGHVDGGPIVEIEPQGPFDSLHRRPHSRLETVRVADLVGVLFAPLPHGVDEVLGRVTGGAETVWPGLLEFAAFGEDREREVTGHGDERGVAGLRVDGGHEHRVRAGAFAVVAVVAAHEEDVDIGLVRPEILGAVGLAGAVAEEARHRIGLDAGEDRADAQWNADDECERDDEDAGHLVLPGPVSVPAAQPEVGHDHHEDPDHGHEHGGDGEEVQQRGAGDDRGGRAHGSLDQQVDEPDEQSEDEESEHDESGGPEACAQQSDAGQKGAQRSPADEAGE